MRRFILLSVSISILLAAVINFALALGVNEIASNFRKEYKRVKNFSADFEQTTFVAGKKRVVGGKLSFQKPNLLRQEYFDPSNPKNTTQLIVSDGKILWSYTPMIKQVTKQNLLRGKDRLELLPGFGQSLEDVEENYNLALVNDELAEKRGVHVVGLTPKNQDGSVPSVFDVLQVWIQDKDSVPVQFMYKDNKNETTFILSFKNVRLNEKLGESSFKFEVPAGVHVITVPNK